MRLAVDELPNHLFKHQRGLRNSNLAAFLETVFTATRIQTDVLLAEQAGGKGDRRAVDRVDGAGVKRAAAELGQGSDAYALHVKGLEMPGWAPRGTPGMGLAYMTADRGACHQRGFMVAFEVGGELYQGQPVDTYALEKKAEILKEAQDYLAGLDALVSVKAEQEAARLAIEEVSRKIA